ncbi:MAG: hypothetical protein KAW92_02070 [Candidatus Cloacimonetes bacterium]|nr:hypothetical protein [Candidatus Cloacimonadota bacterium]
MEKITLPKNEYLMLKREIQLLLDNEFLKKLKELIDIMFEEKYSLFMGDYTDDLTEYSINNEKDWKIGESRWDNV